MTAICSLTHQQGCWKYRGTITQDSYTVDESGNYSVITVDRGEYTGGVQYYIEYQCIIGSNVLIVLKEKGPPINTPPTNTHIGVYTQHREEGDG